MRPLYCVGSPERALALRGWSARMGVDVVWAGAARESARGSRDMVYLERGSLRTDGATNAWLRYDVWPLLGRGGTLRWVGSEAEVEREE